MAHVGGAERVCRMAQIMGIVTSGDSLIRRQRREEILIPEPRIIGVDEFALRKSPYINYGTLIVDLDRHRPIAVLDGDQAETFSLWLKSHPGIEIITRDRDEAYATAGRLAAPGAIQVADRFHLVRNAGEVLKKLFRSQSWKVPSPDSAPTPAPRKLAQWEEVKKRRVKGESRQTIATSVGLCTATVSRYLSQDRPPIRTPRLIHTKIGPFLSYLQQRWEEGCHSSKQLYEEIIQRGYQGKLTKVIMALRPLREGKDLPKPPPPLLRWLLRPSCTLKPEENQDLNQILLLNPSLAKGYFLKEWFVEIIQQGNLGDLYKWLKEASSCRLKHFLGMATGIQEDLEAVKNALLLPWSNAQCEGQICRVKLIKRAGYGRAKIDLLRKRILHRLVTC
jgi:transposase